MAMAMIMALPRVECGLGLVAANKVMLPLLWSPSLLYGVRVLGFAALEQVVQAMALPSVGCGLGSVVTDWRMLLLL